MADITLARPAQGEKQTVQCAPDALIVLDFPAAQTTMEKEGDSLVFKFDDGSAVTLENFYQQYNAESIPEFQVDGRIIAGADFFNAFGPDIAPAVGPGGSQGGNRYHDYANLGLADGISHLNELDWGMRTGAQYEERERHLPPAPPVGTTPDPGPQPPEPPLLPEPPLPPDTPAPQTYNARLIVGDSAEKSDSFSFQIIDEHGRAVTPSGPVNLTFEEGGGAYFEDPHIGPDGLVTVKLTDAGKAAVSDGKQALDKLHVNVDGRDYTMELLINGGQSYDTATRDPAAAEWYARNEAFSGAVTLGGTGSNWVRLAAAEESDEAYAMDARSGAHNSITGTSGLGTVTMDVSAAGVFASAMVATEGGANSITGTSDSGDVSMEVSAAGSTSADGASVYTMMAGEGANSITGTSKFGAVSLDVSATSSKYEAYAMDAGSDANNSIAGTSEQGAVTMNVSAAGMVSHAMKAHGEGANNSITGTSDSGDVSMEVSAASKNYAAMAMYANDKGTNSITGASKSGTVGMDVSAKSENLAYAMQADGEGANNSITGTNELGAVNIDVSAISTGKGFAAKSYAMFAEGGANTVEGRSQSGDVSLDIRAEGAVAAAMKADHDGANNSIAGTSDSGAVSINLSAHSLGIRGIRDPASAMFAEGGANTVEGRSQSGDVNLDINAVASGQCAEAAAMKAYEGVNSLVAQSESGDVNVNISTGVELIDGVAYAMFAESGTNSITAESSGSITVTISAAASELANAYAMWATDEEGKNSIVAKSQDGAHISLTGNIYAQDEGINEIITGAGADIVRIDGNIFSSTNGVNTIGLGDGNDVISLRGSVGANSLSLDGGEGYDTLVLKAENFQEFQDNYGSLFTDNSIININAVHVEVHDPAVLAEVQSYFAAWNNGGAASLTYSVGSALMLDGYQDEQQQSDMTLSDILSNMGLGQPAVTEIHLEGGQTNTLTIDNLLEANGLRISGDADDTVKLSAAGDWQISGTQTDADTGNTYTVYTNEADQSQILIQEMIKVSFGS